MYKRQEFHTTSKAEIHCWDNNTSKQWDGEWTDPDEFRYAFKLMLRREGQRVDGNFQWTLSAAPKRSGFGRRIGQQTSEHVKGSFDPRTGLLDLEGLDVGDRSLTKPDRYKLVLNAECFLVGSSKGENDKWDSVLKGRPVDLSQPTPMIDTRTHGSPVEIPATQETISQSQLPGLPGQSAQDQVIIAAGGTPISPLGALLYKKT